MSGTQSGEPDQQRSVGTEHVGHYFVAHPSSLADVRRSADLVWENAGVRSILHRHACGEQYNGFCEERPDG